MDETFHRAWPAAGAERPGARQELEAARLLARLLDDAIPIPGTSYRIGIDPLLGLFPVVGDLLGAFLSSWILLVASRLGAPSAVVARMALNVALDAVVGAVPLAGDLFDAGWKANIRNMRLLEGWLADPRGTRRASRWLVTVVALGAVLVVVAAAAGAWALLAWAVAGRGG